MAWSLVHVIKGLCSMVRCHVVRGESLAPKFPEPIGGATYLHVCRYLLGAGNKNLKMQAASRGSIWCSFSPAANQRSLP
jgi:hypothetical protein